MDTYADHVVALLDHLGIDEAVVGGVSLGGNVSLLVAAQAPERVRGLVIEMPVLAAFANEGMTLVDGQQVFLAPLLLPVYVCPQGVGNANPAATGCTTANVWIRHGFSTVST